MDVEEAALEYHARAPPGKLSIATTKPTETQRDLTLAYSPGVAAPCERIAADVTESYTYTTKGNLVGVVTDGSAVLGLGDIGPDAAKPVMEGKAVLFKRFADVDVFDVELDVEATDALVEVVAAMEPTFGGINLEDIAAPACFKIEARLSERMDVPVFHDDQHGTAIITGAALLNGAEIQEKPLGDLSVVVSGAGASAIATARFYTALGVPREQITMVDSTGILTQDRAAAGDLNEHKAAFAQDRGPGDLADAMAGADVFVGLSVGDLVTPEMVRSMAPRPMVFAMANPDPEIGYAAAKSAREDTVVAATGRSDYPNQINNVLGFPFIFRGALDVRATEINEPMKVAAARALAQLAHEPVPESVRAAYDGEALQFGPDYVIPKPFDSRVLPTVAPAVAEAAMDAGVARREIDDLAAYREELAARIGSV